MANGRRDWWNQGVRTAPREKQGGITGIDAIDRILQTGRSMAGMVQDYRDKRDRSQSGWLYELSKGFESNYSDTSIQGMKDRIADYKKNNTVKMSADVIDMFGLYESKINEHHDNIKHYNTMIGDIDALPGTAYTLVEDLATHSLLSSEADKLQYAKDNWTLDDGTVLTRSEKEQELIDVYTEFSTNMNTFFGRHGERVTRTNPYLSKKYLTLQRVLVDSVDALSDGKITPGESQYLKSNLIVPDPDKILKWNNTEKQTVDKVDKTNRESIIKFTNEYENITNQLESGFTTIEAGQAGIAPDSDIEGDSIYIGENRDYYFGNPEGGGYIENEEERGASIQQSKNLRNSLLMKQYTTLQNAKDKNAVYYDKYGLDIMGGLGFPSIGTVVPEGAPSQVPKSGASRDELISYLTETYKGNEKEGLRTLLGSGDWTLDDLDSIINLDKATYDGRPLKEILGISEGEPPPGVDVQEIKPQYKNIVEKKVQKHVNLTNTEKGLPSLNFGESWDSLEAFSSNTGLNNKQTKKLFYGSLRVKHKGIKELNSILGIEDLTSSLSKENIYKLKEAFDNDVSSYEETLESMKSHQKQKDTWDSSEGKRAWSDIEKELNNKIDNFHRKWGWGVSITKKGQAGLGPNARRYDHEYAMKMFPDLWKHDREQNLGGASYQGRAAFALSAALNYFENVLPEIEEESGKYIDTLIDRTKKKKEEELSGDINPLNPEEVIKEYMRLQKPDIEQQLKSNKDDPIINEFIKQYFKDQGMELIES